jgi:long-chain acyl-CoA synthetase
VLVVGDRRPYLVALITLDEAEVGAWAREQGIEGNISSLAGDDRVRTLVQGVVDDVNRDRTRHEQIKRFALLPRDFSPEAGEITPTLKLKRRVCEQNFAAELGGLYS